MSECGNFPPGTRQHPGPRIGVSACLLGHAVRYDGAHRLSDRTARATRGAVVVPVCPEVEFGLPVPRPPIGIVVVAGQPRLRRVEDGEDLTEAFRTFALARATALLEDGLDALILKERSPSCGLLVPVRCEGDPVRRGRGFFAAAVAELAPWLPLVEDEDLDEATALAFRRRADVLAALRTARAPEEARRSLAATPWRP